MCTGITGHPISVHSGGEENCYLTTTCTPELILWPMAGKHHLYLMRPQIFFLRSKTAPFFFFFCPQLLSDVQCAPSTINMHDVELERHSNVFFACEIGDRYPLGQVTMNQSGSCWCKDVKCTVDRRAGTRSFFFWKMIRAVSNLALRHAKLMCNNTL